MAFLRTLLVAVFALAAQGALAQTGQQLYTSYCQGCHNFPGNNHNGVLNGKDWTVILQAIMTVAEMRIEVRPVYQAGILDDADLMAIAGFLQTFPGGNPPPPPPPVPVPVVEYFNAGFGHYFMTAQTDEITGLDGGAFGGAFVRTGRQFKAWATPETGTVQVCRFFTTPGTFGAKSSHFYTANPVECDGLKLNPNWIYEKIAFFIAIPTAGACPAGTVPIFRMYNDGQTGAPNHRFTTDFALYQQFTTTLGWLPEDIAFCAPP
ncbi:MAG TPA: c-type cytochrome [Casimicrobiaceae bacterium]|jgi:cytochrome c553